MMFNCPGELGEEKLEDRWVWLRVIGASLKNKGFEKKTKTYKILGCEYNFFIKWLW